MSLESLSQQFKQIKDRLAEVKADANLLNVDLKKVERSLLEEMNAENVASFKNEYGSFSVGARTSVKLPATPEDWSAFWQYLSVKDAEDALKTVNSAKLNAWYKEEFKIAQEEGNMDFSIPGLKEPTISEYISMRKV